MGTNGTSSDSPQVSLSVGHSGGVGGKLSSASVVNCGNKQAMGINGGGKPSVSAKDSVVSALGAIGGIGTEEGKTPGSVEGAQKTVVAVAVSPPSLNGGKPSLASCSNPKAVDPKALDAKVSRISVSDPEALRLRVLQERMAQLGLRISPMDGACAACNNSGGDGRALHRLRRRHGRGNATTLQHLCSSCVLYYNRTMYCALCFQVYPDSTLLGDPDLWLTCFKCQRLSHVECFRTHRFTSSSSSDHFSFLCLHCSNPKSSNKQLQKPSPLNIDNNGSCDSMQPPLKKQRADPDGRDKKSAKTSTSAVAAAAAPPSPFGGFQVTQEMVAAAKVVAALALKDSKEAKERAVASAAASAKASARAKAALDAAYQVRGEETKLREESERAYVPPGTLNTAPYIPPQKIAGQRGRGDATLQRTTNHPRPRPPNLSNQSLLIHKTGSPAGRRRPSPSILSAVQLKEIAGTTTSNAVKYRQSTPLHPASAPPSQTTTSFPSAVREGLTHQRADLSSLSCVNDAQEPLLAKLDSMMQENDDGTVSDCQFENELTSLGIDISELDDLSRMDVKLPSCPGSDGPCDDIMFKEEKPHILVGGESTTLDSDSFLMSLDAAQDITFDDSIRITGSELCEDGHNSSLKAVSAHNRLDDSSHQSALNNINSVQLDSNEPLNFASQDHAAAQPR